jgi:hypothetical protein
MSNFSQRFCFLFSPDIRREPRYPPRPLDVSTFESTTIRELLGTPPILTDDFRGFPQSLEVNSGILLQFSVVGIATGYALDDRASKFESRYCKKCSLLHIVQTGSGVHPVSYPMFTGVSVSGVKATRA